VEGRDRVTTRDRILLYLRDCNYSPTVREIGTAVGLTSPATVHYHLELLELRGVIERHGAERRISVKDAA
jgi:repressor LexA